MTGRSRTDGLPQAEQEGDLRQTNVLPNAIDQVGGSGAVALGGVIYVSGSNAAGRDIVIREQHIHLPEASAAPAPFQLPADLPDFTDRDGELTQLLDLLRSDGQGAGLVVASIFGKPGVGKTALALRVAHEVSASFPDGHLYVNLRGADEQKLDPLTVLADFLRALGADGPVVPPDLESRARMYRERLWRKRALILLDNASDACQVQPLLPGSATCRVLITSRRPPVGIQGLRTFPIDVLEPRYATALLAKLVGEQRVTGELNALEEIADLCGFLPLALRLAGGRLVQRQTWRLEKLVERLATERTRLDELQSGSISDQDIRSSFWASYSGLGDDARRAFRLVGIIRSSDFTAWRIAAFMDCDMATAERLAEQLVIAQLVDESGTDALGQERFRIHDLLRVFARELLAEEESEAETVMAARRAITALIRLAHRAAARLEPGEEYLDEDASWWAIDDESLFEALDQDPLTWFEVERRTLVAAIEYAYEVEAWDLTWRLATTLPGFLDFQARWDEWEQTHKLALEATRRDCNRGAEAAMLRFYGRLMRYRGRRADARKCCRESIEICREIGDKLGEAQTTVDLIRLDWYEGSWETAHQSYARALDIFQAQGHRYGEAKLRHSIGLVVREQGRWDEAIDQFVMALTVFREIGDKRWMAAALWSLSEVYCNQGKWEFAVRSIEEGLSLLQSLKNRWWEAVTLRTLCDAERGQGRFEQAEEHATKALAILQDSGHAYWVAIVQISLADVFRAQGRLQEAREVANEALTTFQDLDDRRWVAIANCTLGDIFQTDAEWSSARQCYELGRAEFSELSDHYWTAKAMAGLGSVFFATDHRDQAFSIWREALETFEGLGAWQATEVAALLQAGEQP